MPFLHGSKAHELLSRLSPVKERLPPDCSHWEQPEVECETFQYNSRKVLVCKLQCNVAKFLRINMIKFIKQKLFGIGMVYTFCWNQ